MVTKPISNLESKLKNAYSDTPELHKEILGLTSSLTQGEKKLVLEVVTDGRTSNKIKGMFKAGLFGYVSDFLTDKDILSLGDSEELAEALNTHMDEVCHEFRDRTRFPYLSDVYGAYKPGSHS